MSKLPCGCVNDLIIDASVTGLGDLTVRILRMAVERGFIPHSDWTRDVAHVVSSGTFPVDAPPVDFHGQGEVIDEAVEFLSTQARSVNPDAGYMIDDNSLWYTVDCGRCDV